MIFIMKRLSVKNREVVYKSVLCSFERMSTRSNEIGYYFAYFSVSKYRSLVFMYPYIGNIFFLFAQSALHQ